MVQWVRSPDGANVELTIRPYHSQPQAAARSALAACGVFAGAVAGTIGHLGVWYLPGHPGAAGSV